MPILFALVARGTCVLAEYSAGDSNAAEVAVNILAKTASVDSRISYAQESHLFHLLCDEGLTYMCMADEVFGRRLPFAFLEDTAQRFTAMHGRAAAEALPYECQASFAPIMAQQMTFFSSDEGADVMQRVRGEILDVKRGMVENIDRVLDRGEKIDLLVDKAATLHSDAFRFKRTTRQVRRTFWWQHYGYLAAVSSTTTAVVYLLVAEFCGWELHRCIR